ncbi:MAG: hypothetical protein K2O95_07395, partial [Clostridia bacterium]|nr:hypothetical protein [Clostridia bacterium]MDE6758141.1 hypothetical protein [Clostridia bacterium]MDE7079921.1 hypothetical protein [Clostridia bacterium]
MKDKHKLLNVYGDDLDQGLVPATEEEIKLCEEKLKSIGALPEGYVKIDGAIPSLKSSAKYYKLVKLDSDQQEQKLKAENLRRLRNINKLSRTQVILQSIMLGFVALTSLFVFVALFLLDK